MSLHKFALCCSVLAFSILLHAAHGLAQTRALVDVMRDMGLSLSSIARPVNQGTAGAPELIVAQRLVQLIGEATLIPPVDVNEEGLVRYQTLMKELHLAAIKLEAALAASDLVRAQSAVRLLGSIRNVGHGEFKP